MGRGRGGKRTPPIDQDGVAGLGLDVFGILHGLPGKLGEGFPLREGAAFLLPEVVFLAVGRVPDPVHEEVRDVE